MRLGLAQVEAQAFLAARVQLPVHRHAVGLPRAQRVAGGRLDFDHLGAEGGPHLREDVAGEQARKVEPPHAPQRTHGAGRIGALPWRLAHSDLMPASFATCFQRSISVPISAPKAAGVMAEASAPSFRRKAFMSGSASAVLMSRFSRSTMAAGTPAGASTPHHSSTS